MSNFTMRSCLLAAILTSTGLLTACGGGGGSVVATPLSPSAVGGTISGLGSVILNGVRYETIGASVLDSDDSHTITSPLGLGMTISIEASATSATTASTIHVQSGLKGSTSAVDNTAKTLNVAGLPVTTDVTTFILKSDGINVGSFNDLLNGQQVDVYGVPQSDGTFKATRIEIETAALLVQLVGVVSNLDTSNKAFSLGVGGNLVTVSYATVTVPTGLANGSVVSVHTDTTASASNYSAASLYLRSTDVTTFNQYVTNYAGTTRISNEVNELYGMVSGLSLSGSGCTLQVQGVPTSLTSQALCASLQNGDYVEVKGLFVNGTLTAHRMEFRTAGGDRSLTGYNDDSNDSDGDHLKYTRLLTSTSGSNTSSSATTESASSYEVYGTLSSCSAGACTLTVNGAALNADLSTATWEHGVVTTGFVEAKGYMTGANTFKVVKIESKR